jgi:hypothetical protein
LPLLAKFQLYRGRQFYYRTQDKDEWNRNENTIQENKIRRNTEHTKTPVVKPDARTEYADLVSNKIPTALVSHAIILVQLQW